MIKNVIFDIGNVLMKFDWDGYMASLFGDDREKITAVNKAVWDGGSWQGMDSGELNGEAAVQKAVSFAPDFASEIRLAFANAGNAMYKHEYAIPWLKELKMMGKSLYYLSNYSEFAMKAKEEALTFLPYMDGGIFSCFVKLAKPDHAIYNRLSEKYRLNPAECLFTDDLPQNIQAAKECGFNAILFEGYEKTYPVIMEMCREK